MEWIQFLSRIERSRLMSWYGNIRYPDCHASLFVIKNYLPIVILFSVRNLELLSPNDFIVENLWNARVIRIGGFFNYVFDSVYLHESLPLLQFFRWTSILVIVRFTIFLEFFCNICFYCIKDQLSLIVLPIFLRNVSLNWKMFINYYIIIATSYHQFLLIFITC